MIKEENYFLKNDRFKEMLAYSMADTLEQYWRDLTVYGTAIMPTVNWPKAIQQARHSSIYGRSPAMDFMDRMINPPVAIDDQYYRACPIGHTITLTT